MLNCIRVKQTSMKFIRNLENFTNFKKLQYIE